MQVSVRISNMKNSKQIAERYINHQNSFNFLGVKILDEIVRNAPKFTMLQQTRTSQTFFLFSSIYQPTSMFTMHSLQNEKRPKCIIESFETLMTRNSIRNSAVEARLAVATGKEKELWNWSRSVFFTFLWVLEALFSFKNVSKEQVH